ncbi:type 1 fimbrial protein, partial [Escherichia coli]|nr:type 1 fimbrial protein [Escherichia coli]
MTIRLCGLLLIALSVGSAAAAAKNQGHGKVSLGGTIVETPCGIASDSLDQTG